MPDPPVLGKVTHASVELLWGHVKEKLEPNQRYKFTVQELSQNIKREWATVYSGYGITRVFDNLEPSTEYSYRLCVTNQENEKSEFSQPLVARTTKEPLNGEAFHKAIILDRLSDVEKILDSNSTLKFFEIPDKFGNLPLMIAIIRNHYEIFELLVARGADVNAQSESKKTALMIAAFYGRLDMVKELRRNGALYEIRDKSGCQAIHYAVDGGNIPTLEWMLYDGADVNVRDEMDGWTPLIRAASVNASFEVARILIKFKAKLDVIDKENKSALLIATINGNLPFVKVLVENGANFDVKNKYGKSLYDLAVSMDRRLIVKYFEEHIESKTA